MPRHFLFQIFIIEVHLKKEYWKIINNNKNTKISAPLKELCNYFKNDNNPTDANIELDAPDVDTANYLNNEEINLPITEKETIGAVASLKNIKSPGIDQMLTNTLRLHYILYFQLT